MDHKQKCWACTHPLNDHQSVCLECNNWQNWRRYLNLSATTLSLLIALISVATVSIPVIMNVISDPRAAVKVGGGLAVVSPDPAKKDDKFYHPFTDSKSLSLKLLNIGEADVTVETYIGCNVAGSNKDDEFSRFETRSSTFVLSKERLEISYDLDTDESNDLIAGYVWECILYYYPTDREEQLDLEFFFDTNDGIIRSDFSKWDD